jgi:hypothetical protein
VAQAKEARLPESFTLVIAPCAIAVPDIPADVLVLGNDVIPGEDPDVVDDVQTVVVAGPGRFVISQRADDLASAGKEMAAVAVEPAVESRQCFGRQAQLDREPRQIFGEIVETGRLLFQEVVVIRPDLFFLTEPSPNRGTAGNRPDSRARCSTPSID